MLAMESLPEDLLHQVLSYLPFPWVVRVRMTCRRWYSVLTSPPFFVLWASRSSSPSLWLLLHNSHHSKTFSICNPFSNRCYPLPAHNSDGLVAASCHGALLCVSSFPSLISLFNPLTRRTLILPPPTYTFSFLCLGIAANPSFSSFYIIGSGYSAQTLGDQTLAAETQTLTLHPHTPLAETLHGPTISAELYDSTLGSWLPLPAPSPLLLDHRSPRTQNFVWWNEKFCILSSNRVVTYDVHGSRWGSIKLPSWPRIWNPSYLTLHVIKGRLFLEGNFQEQGDFQRRFPLLVGIVELDPMTEEWVEMGFMPKELSNMLCNDVHLVHSMYTSHSDVECEQICFSPYPTRDQERIVLYHVGSRIWTSELVCFGGHGIFSGSPNFKGLTFQPNLAALSFASRSDCGNLPYGRQNLDLRVGLSWRA